MAPLKVLICGGGCAGPALAFWLARAGHAVTIVERFPVLRAKGAQIDLRAQGIQVVKRMGLVGAIRAKLVDEDGVSWVDSSGRVWATFMANKSGKGSQSFTSEYEIMRGDLVRIFYEATKDKVQYRFGLTVEHFEQDDAGVTAHFSNGKSETFDILVGADGQGSRIRKAILPADVDPLRHLGIYLAYWFRPVDKEQSKLRAAYHAPGGRMVMTRVHKPTEGQAYLILRDDSDELRSIPRASIDRQKEFWSTRFRDAGWRSAELIDTLKTTDDFYCQEIVQVRTSTWSKERVVLLADAAHCPSPMSGMGTTSALVGAYVLAGEIVEHSTDLPTAFSNYDRILRPFVDDIQRLPTWVFPLALPESLIGTVLVRLVAAVLALLRIPQLMARFSSEDKGGWHLPEYSGLAPVAEEK